MADPTPTLPQDTPDPDARRRALAKVRGRYGYAADADNPLAPIAVAGAFPFAERYGLRWALPYLPQLLRSLLDTQSKKLWYGVRGWFGGFDKMKAFEKLFSPALGLPPPEELRDYLQDGVFARNRLDGPNPLLLARVRSSLELLDRLAIDEAQFQSVMGAGRTLAQEIADGNLFIADYRLLERSLIPPSPINRDSRWRDKYLPAPVALFCQRPGADPMCDLVPVAIRVDQADAQAPNPLYLRAATPAWTLAKTFVEIAEFNLQAMSSHIYRHHYVAEPFAVTTHRQLSTQHPIFVLLAPHIQYTIAVNSAAFGLLKKPGSIFDEIYAGELPETREIMIRSYQTWTVREQQLEADLAARGVESSPADYPWRDDARLWWPPIQRFVDGYLRLYYRDDAAVAADDELQAWATELTALDGGRLRGLLAGPRLETVGELVEVLSQFLFTAGPGHASVHYPQTDYFTYIPAFPGAAYRPPPRAGEPIDEQRIRQTLPPFKQGADQFQNNQIAFFRFDRFGDYRKYPLGQLAAAQPLVTQLGDALRAVEQTIADRNRARARPYLYMLPSLVPNSINI